MVLTAFMYKARKPRNEVIPPSTEDSIATNASHIPDYLHQEYYDDLIQRNKAYEKVLRELAPGDPK